MTNWVYFKTESEFKSRNSCKGEPVGPSSKVEVVVGESQGGGIAIFVNSLLKARPDCRLKHQQY